MNNLILSPFYVERIRGSKRMLLPEADLNLNYLDYAITPREDSSVNEKGNWILPRRKFLSTIGAASCVASHLAAPSTSFGQSGAIAYYFWGVASKYRDQFIRECAFQAMEWFFKSFATSEVKNELAKKLDDLIVKISSLIKAIATAAIRWAEDLANFVRGFLLPTNEQRKFEDDIKIWGPFAPSVRLHGMTGDPFLFGNELEIPRTEKHSEFGIPFGYRGKQAGVDSNTLETVQAFRESDYSKDFDQRRGRGYLLSSQRSRLQKLPYTPETLGFTFQDLHERYSSQKLKNLWDKATNMYTDKYDRPIDAKQVGYVSECVDQKQNHHLVFCVGTQRSMTGNGIPLHLYVPVSE